MEIAMAELQKPSDEFDILGEYVASEIRSLQLDHNKRKLKRIIQKAILDMSEIDENERSTARSTQSGTIYSKETEDSHFFSTSFRASQYSGINFEIVHRGIRNRYINEWYGFFESR